METIIIAIHLMIVVALVGVILLQKSEGGALGIGGGGGFMSGRGAANTLTRTTTWLAVAFFLTSIGLTILHRSGGEIPSILDRGGPAPSAPATPGTPAPQGGGSVFDQFDRPQPSAPQQPAAPQVPQSE